MSVPRSENDKNLLFQLKTRFHWQNKEDSDQGFRPRMQTGDWCRQVPSQAATVTPKPSSPREADARRRLTLHRLHVNMQRMPGNKENADFSSYKNNK